ncbi:hypothetical protein [Pedobacter sp. SYSU D00535]|uniref:hypothetical protein n=1 Tax=Pedobacter sp. SYSU D00535 TaxID=2810308 RepID=UPI001A96B465|nr:hypothetical protein [Pedobacter sp. SYSU D00535]
MDTIEIEINNPKAMKLLLDMEELNLIKVIKKKVSLSGLRKQVQSPMSEEDINRQLTSLRNEWQRDI